jgi:hypothetical protein
MDTLVKVTLGHSTKRQKGSRDIALLFEARHPRCVNHIIYMVNVQTKHNYLIY